MMKAKFIEFDRDGGTMEINNLSINIILFGGEKYTEPIAAQGLFLMNTQLEIAEAYKDFRAGKYGRMSHSRNNV